MPAVASACTQTVLPESLLFYVACFLVEDSKLAPAASDLPPRNFGPFLGLHQHRTIQPS